MTEKRQTSQGYIIRILHHFATKPRKHLVHSTRRFGLPMRRPAVFSQTATLSSLISRQFFSLFNDTDG